MTRGGDIAVIGMGCRFPGADRADVFYRNLLENKDCVQEIPADRWRYADLYSDGGGDNRIVSKWGGFISGVDEFDPRFFKILPSEAELLDPQQKLYLTCSWEALEDAGYARRGASGGKRVGVYAGVTWNEFSLYANEYGYLRDHYKGAGSLYWGIPNRVSYFFDFQGPSIAIDTACSSSLVAVHLASQSLRSGECEMALAGGVNLNLHPAKYLFLSSSNFLSRDGKCRGFGEGGSGYVPAEGVAVIVLKTLAAAVAARDRIYGIIKATATNHGGRATGYTVPNPRAHQQVIRSALDQAQVSARDIGYVECHGTGTDLGDPIEIAGLRLAFEETTRDRQFCGIGTVKSNIGHCEATAGVAGLIKVLLSMRAGTIPATLHAQVPNPKIDFTNSPFYLVRENAPWRGNGTRLAGLSSFGAGGSNCHCVLQAYAPESRAPAFVPRAATRLVPISSLNVDRTVAYCQALSEFLQTADVSLGDLARSLRRRESFEHRIVFLADSIPALRALLDRYVATRPVDTVMTSRPFATDADAGGLLRAAVQWVSGEVSLQDPAAADDGEFVSLPTYAFEKNRSWIDPAPCLYQKQTHAMSTLHPLVDANVSTASRGRCRKTLYRSEYFLDQHWVQGNPVLPGVCLVEMATFFARTYLESANLELRDLWFLEPIALRETDTMPIELEVARSADGASFQVLSREGSVKHAAGTVRTHAVGDRAPVIDLNAVTERCRRSVTSDQFYDRFVQSGIVQKGSFRLVSGFRYNESEAIAKLTVSDGFLGETRYVMNPTLLDGAVQTAMMHVFQRLPQIGTILPFQVGSCVCRRAAGSVAFVVATLTNAAAKKYDVAVCDESGRVLIELRDFVLREYRAKHEQNRLLAFAPVFEERPLVAAAVGSVPSGCLVAVSPASAGFSATPPHWSRVDWASPAAEQALGEWIAGTSETVARIVLVLGEPPAGEAAGALDALAHEAHGLFACARVLAASDRPADVIVCRPGASDTSAPFARACLAFLKCLNLELPKQRFRLVEMSGDVSDADAFALLAAEFAADDGEVYVRYQAGRRCVQRLEAVEPGTPAQDTQRHPRGEPDAWIVTGAGGRLGMAACRLLLARGKRVVLLGRSALGAVERRSLDGFAADSWEYVRCDLTVEREVARAVEKAAARFGDIWGVVHCAGTIADAAFFRKEWSVFERVVRTKAAPLLLLCAALAGRDVRRIVLYSSLTSMLGNCGQTDYAFANGFLDGFAPLAGALLPSRPIVTAVNWPYWVDGGMQIGADKLPAYVEHFMTQPLPTTHGLGLLERLLPAGPSEIGAVYSSADVGAIASRLALKRIPEPEIRRMPRTEASAPGTALARAESGSSEEYKRAIRRYLFRLLENQLKLNLTEDDLEVQFAELGVDSIAQMDLINKLNKEKRFENIPQTLLVENTTIAKLTDFFYENHRHADYG